MCIIITKPAGVPVPSDDIIRNCWSNNPDGAGVAVATGKTVIINKGYMHLKDLIKRVHELNKDDAAIIHLRIATSGGIRADVTHPYPVIRDDGKLRATYTTCNIAIAHNGTISNMATDKRTSDTMAFVRDIAAPLRTLAPDMLHNDTALDILDAVANSKLALLNSAGDIVTIGDFIDDNGVLYSNTSYRPYVYGVSHKYDSVWSTWTDNIDDVYTLPDLCNGCPNRLDCSTSGPICYDGYDETKPIEWEEVTNHV